MSLFVDTSGFYALLVGSLPLVTVQWVSSELHRRAVDRLFRTDKRRVSLVDVVSFAVMETEGLTDVLGLDPDFVVEGFRLLP